jgi:calcineurin-like phosphoesterase family protein
MITSDLHLGHKNICKFRTQFTGTAEEHHETLFENLVTNIKKSDTIYFLGDIAFTKYWLDKIKSIRCRHKLLIAGNHDLERGIKMKDLVGVYDDVKALYSKRDYWFSHCPIHPQEMRGKLGNIHGHLHGTRVYKYISFSDNKINTRLDREYINACVEHTDYKPISFEDLINKE